MKGMLLLEMLGMSYSDIGIDRYKEGDGVEELRVVVDNLEDMVGKGVVDEEARRKVQENLDLLSGVTESDLYGTSVYPTKTNE